MNKQPSIFISYSWADKLIADTIQKDLGNIGIELIRDTSDLKYKDDLKEFMSLIRKTDFSIILLTENYLKSFNCMFEAIQLMEEINFKSKLLPIITDEIKIFKPSDQINFIKFWTNEKKNLEEQTLTLDPITALNVFQQLKTVNLILHSIDDFIKQVTGLKLMSISDLQREYYKSMLQMLGFRDTSIFQEIIRIDNTQNIDEQEVLVDDYIVKFPNSTYGYELRGRIARKQKKFEKAKKNYLKSIELDSKNWQALYNLANLIDEDFNDHIGSIKYYKDAIVANPNLAVARINLGYVYTYYIDDQKKAQEQYAEALKINPNDSDAHAKLANSLRIRRPYDKDRIHFHFKKAIELDPNNDMAYLNYADFFRLINDKLNHDKYEKLGYEILDKMKHK